MREIIEYIDAQIHDCLPEIVQHGICHLINDDNSDRYPSTLEESAKAVYPDDRYEFQYYHRLLDASPEPSEDLSFGRKRSVITTQPVRMVLFVRMKCDDLKFIDDLINAFPDTFEIDLSPTEYKMLNVTKSFNLIRDSNAIWEDEYSEAYKDKYQKVWNIYALEYNIQYIKCPVCVT